MDTEADFQESKKQRYIPGSSIVDLTYTILPPVIGVHLRQVFVYDKTDPSGSKMSPLFAT